MGSSVVSVHSTEEGARQKALQYIADDPLCQTFPMTESDPNRWQNEPGHSPLHPGGLMYALVDSSLSNLSYNERRNLAIALFKIVNLNDSVDWLARRMRGHSRNQVLQLLQEFDRAREAGYRIDELRKLL